MKKIALQFTAAFILVICLFLYNKNVNNKEKSTNSSSSNSSLDNKPINLSAEELVGRGVDKAKLGRFQEAIADYTAALEMLDIKDSIKVDALYNRGVAKDKLGRFSEAIAN